MAHEANYTAAQVAAMLSHYGREEDDGVKRSNENIRPDATASNYVVGIGDEPMFDTRHWAGEVRKYISKKIEQTNANRAAKGMRDMRSDAAVMCDFVYTLPRDWPAERDPLEYFQLCHLFEYDRYGAECSLPGFVHMDETTPHMHCPLVPMVDGEIRKRDLVTRADLKSFHSDLQSFMDEQLGFHVSVLLDEDQKVEKAKSRLSQDEMKTLNADIKAEVEAEVAERQRELDLRASDLSAGEEALARKAEALKRASDARESELDKRERELNEFKQELDEREQEQDRRESKLKSLEVKLDKLKGKLKGISDFVMGWVHWIKEADEKERAARLEEGAEKVAGVEKLLVTVSEEYLEDESHEDERDL